LATPLIVDIQCLKAHQTLFIEKVCDPDFKIVVPYDVSLKSEFVATSEMLCAFESPRYSNTV